MAEILSGTFTSNTNSSTFNIMQPSGGSGVVLAAGTWDSGTLTLQISPDNGTTWISSGSEGQLTADGFFKYEFNSNMGADSIARLNLAGGGGSLDVDYWVM